jgi:hypothetical protein
MEEIRIKRGASLNMTLQFSDDGAPWDVGHVALSAQVRAADGTFVAQLPLVKQSTLGLVTVVVPDTSQWPVGRLRCDLLAALEGENVYSETFAIMVAQSVTRS